MSIKTNKYPVFNSDKELSDFLLNNVTDSLKQSIKVTVSIMVKAEMENLRKEVKEHLQFNGYYDRNMLSTLGKIEGIQIPRWRQTPLTEQNLKSFSVFDQQKQQFEDLVAEMHRLGISDRKVERLCKTVFGATVNKNRVSIIHKELAEQEGLQINSQPLLDEFEYLLIDGLWVKAKSFGLKNNNKTVLLCALGIKPDGSRKVIGFLPADNEGYEASHSFILGLKQRGLAGKALKLIISDGAEGLTSALKQLFPQVSLQSCMVHKMRNVLNAANHKNKGEIGAGLTHIYSAGAKDEAVERFKAFAKKWYMQEPAAVETLRFNFEGTLTYFQFPKEVWRQIRTNNILEREFREVRRRIKVFDNSFNDHDSLNRYGNSIFSYLNNNYPAAHTH